MATRPNRQIVLTAVFVAILSCVVAPLRAAQHPVKNADDVVEAMRTAKPGDELVMADGSWKDQEVIFNGTGAPDKPITLRAATPGKVSMDDGSHVIIDGNHLAVSGLSFTDSTGTDTLIEIKGSNNRVTDTSIIAPSRGGRFVHFNGGQHNRLDHCYLEGHAPREVMLQVEVSDQQPNEHQIDHNHFGPRPPLGANGGEIIRIGYSHQSMRSSKTVVEHNLFEGCDGEIEIISSKSCDNIYRYNTFRNSEGCLTLRHGNRCTVDGNYFLGNGGSGKPTGGIRVIGEDHVITNNYFEKTSGIAGGVIVLTCGIPDSPLKGYWQIKKGLVAHNTFIDNAATCIVLNAGYKQRGRTLLPENVTIANNIMLASDSAKAKALVTGEEGTNFKWMGNLAQGAEIGAASAANGIKVTDLKLKRGEDGLFRPTPDSPATGAAQGDVPVATDIDGQKRPSQKRDVGCDQLNGEGPVINKPLSAADVGPSWRMPHAAASQGDGAQTAADTQQPDRATKPLELKNDKLNVTFDQQSRKLSIKSQQGRWSAESTALCPQIVNAGGLAMQQVEHKDPLGTTQAIELKSEGGEQQIWLHKDQPFVFTRVNLRASGATDGDLKNIIPLAVRLKPGKASADKLRLLGSDGLAPATKGKTSYVFVAAVEPDSNAGTVAGWITHERASGIVVAENGADGFTVTGRSEYGRNPLAAADQSAGETFVVGFFDDARDGLEQFADVTAKTNNIKLPPVPCGYSTWYHGKATGSTGALDEKRMAQLAKFCKDNHLNEYGLNFLQIDDQWQAQRRDFVTHKPNGPYPGGMKKTAQTINDAGLFAGIWLTPFGWQGQDMQDGKSVPNQTSLKDHPDYFVKRPDGGVFQVRWAGDCLDMSNPDARKFLAETINRMTHDWGYKLLKIDGLWAGMACKILYPSPEYRDDEWGNAVFHDNKKTNEQVYRDGLRLVREAAGKDVFLLGCNIAQNMRTMGGSIGLVDAMRVGPDIKADWGAVVRCATPASRLYFWNGKVWYNDPDCLMLRDPLTVENGRAWASWIAISGQMNLVSEWLPDLPPEKLDIYKRTIPNHKNFTARPVDYFDRDLPRIWHVAHGEGDDRLDLVAIFNWNATKGGAAKSGASPDLEEPTKQSAAKGAAGPITIKLDPAQLGLPDPAQPRAVFDFWDNKFASDFTGPQQIKLEPGTCKVLALKRKLNRPQVVSTSRHISQGIVDLTYVRWHNDEQTLRGKSRVVGGDDYEIRIDAASAKFNEAKLAAEDTKAGVSAAGKQDGNHLRVTIKSPVTREVEWEVRFAK